MFTEQQCMWIKNLSFENNCKIIFIIIESVNMGIAVCTLILGLGECVNLPMDKDREPRTEGAVVGH